MSVLKGKVGSWEIDWQSPPRGPEGSAFARVSRAGGEPQLVEVRWRRDADGIWLELGDGAYGFDLSGEKLDDGGVAYRVSRRGSDQIWTGLSFTRAGEQAAAEGGTGKKKSTRIRAQMPGKIVRVLVASGAHVEKDQPLVVMEAMKMENEIRAPHAGTVGEVKVAAGQAVDSGADLLMLD